MKDKKKYGIEFSEQVRKTIDKILGKKDKKAFDAITNAFREISENPSIGRPITFECNKEILEKLNSYKGRKITRLLGTDYGDSSSMIYDILPGSKIEENLEDVVSYCEKDSFGMFWASFWKDGKRFLSKELKDKIYEPIYFDSAAYRISFLNRDKTETFFIKALAVSV